MVRIVLAVLAAAATATMSLAVIVLTLWPFVGDGINHPATAALHISLFGALLIFPFALALGLPAYWVGTRIGKVSRTTVFIVGVGIALLCPLFIELLQTHHPLVTPSEYAICAFCGFVGACTFCSIAEITKKKSTT